MTGTKRIGIGSTVLLPTLLVAMVMALAISIAPATAQGPPPTCDGLTCHVGHNECGTRCICNGHHNICLDNTPF